MAQPIDASAQLKPEWVQSRIVQLPGWNFTQTSEALAQEVEFPTFRAAAEFVQTVTRKAIEDDRQPEIRLDGRSVVLRVATREAGVTKADWEFARRLADEHPIPEAR